MPNAYQIDRVAVAAGSSYSPEFVFRDEAKAATTPNAGTVTWTLTDKNGNVKNSREDVAIDSANPVVVNLEGEDLTAEDADIFTTEQGVKIAKAERRLSIYGEIDTSLGNDRPTTMELIFFVYKIVAS